MNTLPASERQQLLARSSLCRLQLRRQSQQLRNAMQWKRVAASAAIAPVAQRIAVGLLLSWVGIGRATRLALFAGRAIVFIRIARSAIGYLRSSSQPAGTLGRPTH